MRATLNTVVYPRLALQLTVVPTLWFFVRCPLFFDDEGIHPWILMTMVQNLNFRAENQNTFDCRWQLLLANVLDRFSWYYLNELFTLDKTFH